MKQVIDMGGFKNDTIEVKFGEDTYEVPLDPPIEAYRLILEMVGKKMVTKEEWDKGKEIVATIIASSVYPNSKSKEYKVFKNKFFKSLTIPATKRFIDPYAAFLFKARDSKNPPSPLNKEEKK